MALERARARAAIGHQPEIEAAAEELLRKGNAVDAVVAGVFAACALSPGVLLGPVQLLVGGSGVGALAVDGRVRQPGIGAPRPRGFVAGEEIPDAARVGVPWLPAALSVAVATFGTATFAQVVGPGAALAKGSPRADLLGRIASRGPRAIEERPLSGELLAIAGRPSAGLLTGDDLSSPRPEVQKAARFEVEASAPAPTSARASRVQRRATAEAEVAVRVVSTFPWSRLEGDAIRPPAHEVDIARARAVVAVDRNATFAIACWDEATDGLLVPELGLRAPFFAEPVRRGQTRTRPGEPRPAAGPAALVGDDAAPDVAFAAYGAADAYDVLSQAIRAIAETERIEAHGEASLVALFHAGRVATAFRS